MPRCAPLNKTQIRELAESQRAWTAIGLSTEPTDRAAAEEAIWTMYRTAGLPPPKRIIWCASPAAIGNERGVGNPGQWVGARLWDEPGLSAWRDTMQKFGFETLRVLLPVQTAIDHVWTTVWQRVGYQIAEALRPSQTVHYQMMHGQHDAGALMPYAFVRKIFKCAHRMKMLSGLFEFCKSAGWMLPYANCCWVSERMSSLYRDARGRLHNPSGSALSYPDGWAIHAIHGVRVPGELVERRDSITVEAIEDAENVEIRRVMILIYGTARYLKDCGAKLINKGKRGKLWRAERPGDDPLVMVEVKNASPEPDGSYNTFFLRVPPHIKTAAQAVAWRFGFEVVRDYHPVIET